MGKEKRLGKSAINGWALITNDSDDGMAFIQSATISGTKPGLSDLSARIAVEIQVTGDKPVNNAC